MQWARDTSRLEPWYVFLLFVFLLLIFLIVFTRDFHLNVSDCHENENDEGRTATKARDTSRAMVCVFFLSFFITLLITNYRYYNDYDG